MIPLLLLAVSVYLGIASPGFLEADELAHFLKAREVLHAWTNVLDIWGRPACTGLFGLAAAVGGVTGARMVAVLVTGLTACGTVALFESLFGKKDVPGVFRDATAWLWVLLYAQPLFLMNSFTVMTEMLLAAAWVWAMVLLVRHRTVTAGLVLGLGGLARPEGWIAIAAWPVFLLLWRRFSEPTIRRGMVMGSTLAAGLSVAAWWAVGAVEYGSARWMINRFPWQGHSQYGTTGLLFIASSVIALALWMWIPVTIGATALWMKRDRCAVLTLVLPAGGFFLLHATLGTFGLLGAMSLPRYFICVSPMIAILALGGLQVLASRSRRPRLLRKVVIFLVLMPGFVLVSFRQLPVPKSADMQQLDAVITDFERRVPREQWEQRLIANHPYVYFRTGISMESVSAMRISHPAQVRDAPAGTYVISDSLLWAREHRPRREELEAWGYEEIAEAPEVPTFLDLERWGPAIDQQMPVGLWVKR